MPAVQLFIPCLVDQVYPEIGHALVRILRRLGFSPEYNPEHTCCGQPAFNAGDHDQARAVAARWLDAFAGAETIVCPSGSCVAMVRRHYRDLFAGTDRQQHAAGIAERVTELSEFLARPELLARLAAPTAAPTAPAIGFHNSCHALRVLGITDQPLQILRTVSNRPVMEPPGEPVCCGFGGVFSVKFPEIAAHMAASRIDQFRELDLDTIVANDPGCIVHLRQEVAGRRLAVTILHLAEFIDQATGHLPVSPPPATS